MPQKRVYAAESDCSIAECPCHKGWPMNGRNTMTEGERIAHRKRWESMDDGDFSIGITKLLLTSTRAPRLNLKVILIRDV